MTKITYSFTFCSTHTHHAYTCIYTYTCMHHVLKAPATKSEIDRLISIIDTGKHGKLNILEFDKIIRHYHRILLSQKYDSEPESDEEVKSAVNLTFSPSRISLKCPHCKIGKAEPPKERNLRYEMYERKKAVNSS